MKRMTIGLVALLVMVGASMAWYYYLGPCGVSRVDEATGQLNSLAGEWDDAYSLAASTSRIALSGPVQSLQSTRRDAVDIEVPACLEDAKQFMIEGMDLAIDGFIAFMSEEDDETIGQLFDLAGSNFRSMGYELNKIGECAPFCNN